MTTTAQTSQRRGWLECYFAGLTITAVIAPGIATVATFIIAVGSQYSSATAVLLGMLGGLGVWMVLALVATHFVTIDRAYPAVYRQLCSRFRILKKQLKKVNLMLKERVKEDPIAYALDEAEEYRDLLQAVLGDGNTAICRNPLDWIGAFGYVQLGAQLHRMEEALILLAPLEMVLSDAWHDKLRLAGSTIGNRQELLECLQASQDRLSIPLENSGNQSDSTQQHDSVIRERLRYVRSSINEFRDEQRFCLVRARNRLLKTVALTGCVCFALTAVAVMAITQDQKINLTAAAVFFLVGAIVGLFNQLRLHALTETETATATEDYGLTTARLFHTPLFSGLAALGGVLVIPLLSFLVDGTSKQLISSIASVFNFAPSGLVLAVIFGLSPTALFSRLQQEAERYKTELRKSEANTPGPVVDADSSQRPGQNGTQTGN